MPQIDLGQVVGAQGPQGIQGPQGAQGIQGPAGPAATINGVNALTIEAGANIDLAQEGGTATLSVPTDSTPTAGSTKPVQSGGVAEALNAKPNCNLLDNWYFGNPVNQRGQTSYNTPGYSIDRWYLQGGSFELSDNALTFLFPPVSGGAERFNQRIPLEKFIHGVYTISILTTDGLYSKSFEYKPGDNTDVQFNTGNGVYIGFFTQGGSLPAYRLFNADTSADISVSIIATKLELGGRQTLAHQDKDGNWVLNEIPDYGEELAKCQRYFQTFRTQALRPAYAADFRPVMRTEPVTSTLTIDGVTYYTASADL